MPKRDLCPREMGPVLTSPMRKIIHNPVRITKPYLANGMTAMDIGCAMGFFTLPMSALVGETGKVIAVDLQQGMIDGLKMRAEKAGCNNITTHVCDISSLNARQWDGTVDFALLFFMLHEVPDADRMIKELRLALKPGGILLFVEPKPHVGKEKFLKSRKMIEQCGFVVIDEPKIRISLAAAFRKE